MPFLLHENVQVTDGIDSICIRAATGGYATEKSTYSILALVSDLEGTIIQAVCAGQTDRLAEIVRQYQAALLHLALSRTGSIAAAEEIVQEIFLKVYRFLYQYSSRFSFRT